MPETAKLVEVALVVVPKVAVKLAVVKVPVAVMLATETISPEKIPLPWTEKRLDGVAVPTPTLPEAFSTINLPEWIFKPPAKVEVEILETIRLVTVVVPPSNPPPPQLMQIFPTRRFPSTLRLPAKLEVAVVLWTLRAAVMVVVAAWSWPVIFTLPEKVEVPAPVEEKRPEELTLFEELMVISSGMEESSRPEMVPEMVGFVIVGEVKLGW